MNFDEILANVLVSLKVALPPLIVLWVTNVVKKWKTTLTPMQITTYVVPLLSIVIAIVEGLLFDANYIWSFILGLFSVTLYEMKKNLTEPQV